MNDNDHVLDLAVKYALHGRYDEELTKERKRAVRKRTARLVVERGEVFLNKCWILYCNYCILTY